MSHALERLGRGAARHPWRVIGAWLLATLAILAASSTVGRQLEDDLSSPGLDSQAAVDLLSRVASDQAGLTAQVVLVPRDPTATFFSSDEARRAAEEVQAAVVDLPDVLGTTDLGGALAAGPDAATARAAVAPGGRVALLRLQYPVMADTGPAALEALEALGEDLRASGPLQVEMGGDLFDAFEEAETGTGEVLGLLAAMVVLLLAFGSVVAMGLPIGMALFGLAVGVSGLSLVTYVVEIPAFAPVIAAMVGLGVGIDYALFLVVRHREHLAAGMDVPDAAGRAVATAGQAVVFAGGTVVVAIGGLAVAGLPFITAAAVGISLIVLLMVVAAITLLPAFLGLAGRRVLPRRQRRAPVDPTAPSRPAVSARWQRWGDHVTRHAWAYAIAVTAALLALSAPVLALQLGFPDEGTLPEARTERRAYDLVAEGFGPGANGPLLVAVDLAGDAGVAEPLARALAEDPGISSVGPPEVDLAAGVATIVAVPTTAPQDEATVATVHRLRSEVLPSVLGEGPAEGHVGGGTAMLTDQADRVAQRLPWLIATVVGLSFLLLVLVFRSLLVPLKAAVLNLLSIGAAYGVLVAVFQWGWGASLIGLESTVPIVSFVPMMMFAILFGLSMDYEVFLLTRVREEHLATGDNGAAVIRGLAGTARVITSAALIMVAVFGGFVLGQDPVTKMLGLGLATAIAVDATVVRMVLVPATMKLMGEANWWLPAWLDRWLPTVDLDGAGAGEPLEPPTPVGEPGALEPVAVR